MTRERYLFAMKPPLIDMIFLLLQVNVASVNHGKTARGDTMSFENSKIRKFEKRSVEENRRGFRHEKREIFMSRFDNDDDDEDDDDRRDDETEDKKKHRSEFR